MSIACFKQEEESLSGTGVGSKVSLLEGQKEGHCGLSEQSEEGREEKAGGKTGASVGSHEP
jgi:hypothetical protein